MTRIFTIPAIRNIDIAGHIPYFFKGKLNSFKKTES